MKFSGYVLCIGFVFVVFTAAGQNLASRLSEGDVMICAHRANTGKEVPENSMQGIAFCAQMGIPMVEIDIRESADGQLRVLHDETLDRTTNAFGKITNFTSKELNNVQLKNSGEAIPSFGDMLAFARENGLFLMLDLKNVSVEKVMAEVVRYDMVQQVLVLTFSRDNALQAFGLNKPVMISVLINEPEDLDWYEKQAYDPNLWMAYLNQQAPVELFQYVSSRGRKIVSDTNFHTDKLAQEKGPEVYRDFLAARNINILVSDYPLDVMEALGCR